MPSEDLLPTSFTSHISTIEVNEVRINVRVLKMINSVFIYIAPEADESIHEAGVAMPMSNPKEFIGTTILGDQLGCDSQELATKLSRKLEKQVYLSCNVPFDRMLRPILEKNLNSLIKEHPECF
ncbi:PSMG4 family protein [Megaselia abdita]